MLDVSVAELSLAYPGFSLQNITLTFPKSTNTAIIGPAGCGASTLLKLIAGLVRPQSGTITIGARDVTSMKPARRPLLHVSSALESVPDRWSVQHALIAAVRQRSLDRIDRQLEYDLALAKWRIKTLAERKVGTLSSSERALVQLARVELLKPGIVLADRLLENLNPSLARWAADEIFRTFRVMGATVITAPSTPFELGFADSVAVLSAGRLVQTGTPAEVYAKPRSEAAAVATGDVNAVPVVIRDNEVTSPIGSWTVKDPPFQGAAIALARPEDFSVAAKGEDSDLIFSVEEASFVRGGWLATGLLSGAFLLRVSLPGTLTLSKGKLLPLRYDPTRFSLVRFEV